MKHFIIITCAILLFAGCNKPSTIPELEKTIQDDVINRKNEALFGFGKEFAKSLQITSFRHQLKEDIGKQFDYQYDILYDFIKGKNVVDGNMKSANLMQSLYKKGEIFENKNLFKRPIQISIPVHYHSWDPECNIPPVVVLPVDFDENTCEEVQAICSDGSIIKFSTHEEPTFPVFLICEAERVDENMNLTVDYNGVKVKKEERIPAIESFLAQKESLKSTTSGGLIQIFDEKPTFENLKSTEIENSSEVKLLTSTTYTPFDQLIEDNSVIQAPSPESIILNFSAANRIELDWPSVSGADGYYVAYMSVEDGNWNYLFVQNSKAIFSGLNATEEYNFQIHSVKGMYCSDNSYTQSKIVSGRNKNQAEYISKIGMSKSYYRKIEFWGNQHVELDIIATAVKLDGTTITLTDDQADWRIRDDYVKGKTYTDNHYLFNWNVDTDGQEYSLYFIEDDGSGSWQNIAASVNLIAKAVLPDSKETIWDNVFGIYEQIYEMAAADDPIGEVRVDWHDPVGKDYYLAGEEFLFYLDHDTNDNLFN